MSLLPLLTTGCWTWCSFPVAWTGEAPCVSPFYKTGSLTGPRLPLASEPNTTREKLTKYISTFDHN